MDTIKWLKRKYPNNYKRIMSEFDTKHIKDYMKGYGHIPAILKEDIENYKKGTLFLIKKVKEYDESGYEDLIQYSGWTGQFIVYGLFKCNKVTMTVSGFNHIYLGMEVKHKKLTDFSTKTK